MNALSRHHILAIDQGTTSSRAVIFGPDFRSKAFAQQEFTQHFPRPGHVEHDPEELWHSVVNVVRGALERHDGNIGDIAAIGIANQRETTLLWDRQTGTPLMNAIVWQDRRTAGLCENWRAQPGASDMISARTGLLIDPYFCAGKICWMLDHAEGARILAKAGRLAFGTVDSWLIWKLTGGRRHVCDATNACRTLLYNIHTGEWDHDLCDFFGIPPQILPEILDCSAGFGTTDPGLFGAAIPICGVAGDQHAATIGQACFQPAMAKATYGTGCFVLFNTGAQPVVSRNRLLTTLAFRLEGRTTYALEGSIFIAGAVVKWLRDNLKIIARAGECDALAASARSDEDVFFVPAFVGLGAPHWDADARGTIQGLTRASGIAELVRAALQGVGFQSRELMEAMAADIGKARPQTEAGPEKGRGREQSILRVDGGMAASDWTMQFLADCLDMPVERAHELQATALGAAWLAGRHIELWPGAQEFARSWKAEKRFVPCMANEERARLWHGWKEAVHRTRARL